MPSLEPTAILRRYFSLDVRRFCRDPPAHRRFVDEHLFISPVQGGADYSDPLVFGRLPEKPVHIEQIVFKGGSRRRGQQIIFRAGRAAADSNRRYVRIRFHLRLVFLERVSESPGHRPSRTSPSIQAALLDSHIADICPHGGVIFEKRGVLRSKARVAHVSAGPRVPLLRRPARCREASLLSLARMQVKRGSPYPSRACSPLAVYRAARLPGPGGAVVPSRNVTRAVFRLSPCHSLASHLQFPWRTTLNLLHVSGFVAPQTKTLKCPLRFATGTSNVSFQWESRLLLAWLR